jgi:hypothetical protein
MSFFARRTTSGTRSFPRTIAVLGFVLVSGLAQLQTVVNLHP